MWKKKIFIQIAACLVIAGVYGVIQATDMNGVQEKTASVVAAASRHYTISAIAASGKTAVFNIIKAPAVVTNRIIASSETRKYGVPMDEVSNGETGPVYATAGGKVIETGENEELGTYVKISHNDTITVYGNCYRIYAKENEHIRKGQVIASFTNDGTKEFIYEMIENTNE